MPLPVLNQADFLFQQHPAELLSLLESAWGQGFRAGNPPAVLPLRNATPVLGGAWPTRSRFGPLATRPGPQQGVILPRRQFAWEHLIYAYLIENTRVYEIFRRVVHGLLHGEQLGIPRKSETFEWLRTTEELFYKGGAPLTVMSVDSHLRPDLRATRRSAYHRLLGMDLNHGSDDSQVYPYEKAASANRDFVAVFEEFLRLVWVAISYEGTTGGGSVTGPVPVDPAAIANLAQRLQNMLNERRGSQPTMATLARDEFVAVAAMSWFDVTLSADTPIVEDLQAVATAPEERLRRIGERVGLPPHSRSHDYFILAPLVSRLLIAIEGGAHSTAPGAQLLYVLNLPGGGGTNPTRELMQTIIHHWSQATGRDLKSAAVHASPRFASAASPPTAAPAPAVAPAQAGANTAAPATFAPVSTNGSGPVSQQTLVN
ncbi:MULTISPECIES: hypothetical protein [unclassified Streptomyces]|uniref:hypothetical protein n=1 Tax=unclassified Streptomyces TaxID=2593676 RepID=UPI001BE72B4E|nr:MULTISPECIES: hypothetical protein [unclassified Streptomyces]MBT2403097.1 hypothetical protein [Streptomyces sp. ISL-21]MBT2610226.1 hypothetical protein [Streptomyces sp. ISL-87]